GKHVTRSNLLTRLHGNNRVDGEQVTGVAATLHLGNLTATGNGECGLEAFTTLIAAPVDDHALGEAGGLVGVFRNGSTVEQVFKHDLTLDFSQDRTSVRIPFGQTLATTDAVAFL